MQAAAPIDSPSTPPPPQRRRAYRSGLAGCLFGFGTFIVVMSLLCGGLLLIYALNPPASRNILILGNDARPGSGEDQIARTDSIMVLGIHPDDQQVSILSLPRDASIQSPTFGVMQANLIVRNAELNTEGTGTDAMMQAMETTFAIEMDHYVRLSFDGFVDVVDAVGGITIDVPRQIVDYSYPTHDGGTIVAVFEKGETHMDGETALIYARTRHSDSDYDRASRQQQVLDAVMNKITNPLHAYRLPAVLAAIERNVETDMSIGDMVLLAPAVLLYGSGANDENRFVIDRDDLIQTDGGTLPNVESLQPWLEQHLR